MPEEIQGIQDPNDIDSNPVPTEAWELDARKAGWIPAPVITNTGPAPITFTVNGRALVLISGDTLSFRGPAEVIQL